MRVAVLGAGAIGAYVGAALARGGAEVTLIARGAHLRALQEHGVVVTSPRGDFAAHPAATDDLAAIADADAVFIGLKAPSGRAYGLINGTAWPFHRIPAAPRDCDACPSCGWSSSSHDRC